MNRNHALPLFRAAYNMAANLYYLTVTDAWYHEGGNIEVASRQSTLHSGGGVMAAIRALGQTEGNQSIARVNLLGGRGGIRLNDPASWLQQGRNTLIAKKGICTDLAAAAALKFLEIVDRGDYVPNVEIISSTTHAFVVVFREGDVRDPRSWGAGCFVIDVWYQNQFERNAVAGAFFVEGSSHPVAKFINDNAYRLRCEIELRGNLQPLF